MTKDEQLKLLNDLISDIDCLEPLYRWTNDINIFNVLKLNRVEIRHSNMLAWLLNPNELHGLDDKFLKKFLIYATKGTNLEIMKGLKPVDVDLMDFDDVVVEREKNNIDILLVSEKNKLVFAIENKIDSGEHDNQLNRYREIFQNEYKNNYKFVLIYLTPDKAESTDPENWIDMDYSFILEELSKLIEIYKIPEKAKLYIDDYLTAIRRNIVEDKEIYEICKNIYYKHQKAFDLIFENKPDMLSKISDFIFHYLKENEDQFNITVWPDYNKSYIRFTPIELVEKFGRMGSGEWAHNSNLIAFEIQNFDNYDLTIKVIIGPSLAEFESYRQKLMDIAIKYKYKMRGYKLTNKWKTIKSHTLVVKNNLPIQDNEDYFEDPIGISIDNFVNNQMPKIVEQLLEASK